MTADVTVRPMVPEEQREVIAMAARAFWPDPLFGVFARDPLHEYRALPAVFSEILTDLEPGSSEVWIGEHDGRPRGVAAWAAPGAYPRSPRQEAARAIRSLRVMVSLTNRVMAARLLREVERRHLHEPHWYLALLATDPTVQGRGVGTALLAPVLERCDEQGIPAYLETQKRTNLSWYARSGFEVVEEVRIGDSPPVWCLRREPRPIG
ncbi:MAG: GNAT family N-acetyltransferase [Microthrixaceae bacterium]